MGVSSPPPDPDHWIESTNTCSNSYLRKSTAVLPPALFSVTVALSKCSPWQQCWKRTGLVKSVFFMRLNDESDTLPAPPPPPVPMVLGLLAPQLNESISICFS